MVRDRDALALLRTASDHAQKKTAHAAEQERADVKAARQAWVKGQRDLDLEKLIFIDETAATTKMVRPLRPSATRPALPSRTAT